MYITCLVRSFFFFFFNDTATTEIYTLSLHDALPIYHPLKKLVGAGLSDVLLVSGTEHMGDFVELLGSGDRKSTRLNSSHTVISYAVFCLKKKKTQNESRLRERFKKIES